MAIGGSQNDQYSGKTFYFTTGAKSWTKGPEMKYNRTGHSCGRIKKTKTVKGRASLLLVVIMINYNVSFCQLRF